MSDASETPSLESSVADGRLARAMAESSGRLGGSVTLLLAASRGRALVEETFDTLRRKPSSDSSSLSAAGSSAPSPCRNASTKTALSSSATGCRWYESTSKVRGQSISKRTGLKRMPDWYQRRCRETQGAASTRTASTASAAVARRIARHACFCAELELVFLSWVLLPTGFFLGILNSRTAPLKYPQSRIRNPNAKRTTAEKVLCGDKKSIEFARFCLARGEHPMH